MGDANEGAPPLPKPHLTTIAPGLSLLEPLSRKGIGPGLIVLVPDVEGANSDTQLDIKDGVPSALMKWAEESYTVVEIRKAALEGDQNALSAAVEALGQCAKCEPKGVVGLVSYDPKLWNQVASKLSSVPEIKGAVVYGNASDTGAFESSSIPVLQHLAGKCTTKPTKSTDLIVYDYPKVTSYLFATPFSKDWNYSTESISHTRSLTFLKRLMNGPYFDLEAIWNEHTYFEFEVRSVPQTMATMVEEPYVNHVPTMTGGIGRDRLTHFYANHFVHCNPDDTELELISSTIGIDRVIEEFIFKFTHDREIPWLFPGVPPTGKYCEIPFTGVINIRGDRLYHEHISWDQATGLVQLGLLPEYLPFPHPVKGHEGKKLEYRVPAAGNETAKKMRVKDAVESNKMFEFGIREVK